VSDTHGRARYLFRLSVPDFTMGAGATVLLLGESGSGKSTLLSLICGTIAAQVGTVEVHGTDLGALSAAKRDRFRAEQIGVIFQQFNLLPFASVLDNIRRPLRLAPLRRARGGGGADEARNLLESLGLPSSLSNARAGTLSVGQQQRVAAARALIGQPPLIIADEPTSALDAATQSTFLDLLFARSRANGAGLLMVSHDARLADHFDRVVDMADIAQVERSAG
jgi:putative ABC transport system ATP-binding protein